MLSQTAECVEIAHTYWIFYYIFVRYDITTSFISFVLLLAYLFNFPLCMFLKMYLIKVLYSLLEMWKQSNTMFQRIFFPQKHVLYYSQTVLQLYFKKPFRLYLHSSECIFQTHLNFLEVSQYLKELFEEFNLASGINCCFLSFALF